MPLFRRQARRERDLVSADAMADFGRTQILGPTLSRVGSSSLDLVRPLFEAVHGVAPQRAAALAELQRHASKGEWPAVGAWRFADDFLEQEECLGLRDQGLLALHAMNMTNLSFHLAPIYADRYQQLTGTTPANDGFFGPPVFASRFGPTREYYKDQALAAVAARRPVRVSSASGVEPKPVTADATRCLWDFGMLVMRGPLVVNEDLRFEPGILHPLTSAAQGVDHGRLSQLLLESLSETAQVSWDGWRLLGGARFVEDYLDASLTLGPTHVQIIDLALDQLSEREMFRQMTSTELLSFVERSRLR